MSLPNNLNNLSTCSLTNPTAFATALTAPANAFTANVKTLLIALPIASKSAEFSSINSFNDLNSFLSSSKNPSPATSLLKLNSLLNWFCNRLLECFHSKQPRVMQFLRLK